MSNLTQENLTTLENTLEALNQDLDKSSEHHLDLQVEAMEFKHPDSNGVTLDNEKSEEKRSEDVSEDLNADNDLDTANKAEPSPAEEDSCVTEETKAESGMDIGEESPGTELSQISNTDNSERKEIMDPSRTDGPGSNAEGMDKQETGNPEDVNYDFSQEGESMIEEML